MADNKNSGAGVTLLSEAAEFGSYGGCTCEGAAFLFDRCGGGKEEELVEVGNSMRKNVVSPNYVEQE